MKKLKIKNKIINVFFVILFFLFYLTTSVFAETCTHVIVGATCQAAENCIGANIISGTYSDCVENSVCCRAIGGTIVANNITSNTSANAAFKYTLLESLPGFFQGGTEMTDLPTVILAIYKFGIWTIGISAMFMVTVGGIMYIGSAGNTSAAGKAKEIITDALIGVFAAMGAYLILYVINPDLVKLNINFSAVSLTGSPNLVGDTAPGGGSSASTCQVMTSGPCSVASLSIFGADAEKMAKICSQESGGNVALENGTDHCADGHAFSFGLFGINMMTSANSIGCDGDEIFTGIGSRSNSYNCLDYTTNSKGLRYCLHRNCRVTNITKYNECKAKLESGTINTQIAKSLYNVSRFRPWINSARICKVN